jgi:hypothetical protein
MAKGQQRSNKEVRKPKKPKTAVEAEGKFVGTIKRAADVGATASPKRKG